MTDARSLPHGQPPTGIDPEYLYDAERSLGDGSPPRQPPGLWVLFFTEMWERFSYYGMRALFVLFLVSETTSDNPGFGWTNQEALALYGWYTMLVYISSVPGGWIADRFLGQKKTVMLGGALLCIG